MRDSFLTGDLMRRIGATIGDSIMSWGDRGKLGDQLDSDTEVR
jgi:hypothetical protein